MTARYIVAKIIKGRIVEQLPMSFDTKREAREELTYRKSRGGMRGYWTVVVI